MGDLPAFRLGTSRMKISWARILHNSLKAGLARCLRPGCKLSKTSNCFSITGQCLVREPSGWTSQLTSVKRKTDSLTHFPIAPIKVCYESMDCSFKAESTCKDPTVLFSLRRRRREHLQRVVRR